LKKTGLVEGRAENVTKNDSVNDSVNLQIIDGIKNNGRITAVQLSDIVNKSVPTINRRLKQLQECGLITRVGSDKTGHWEVYSA
jgi:predicted HTH transcriptional regulator